MAADDGSDRASEPVEDPAATSDGGSVMFATRKMLPVRYQLKEDDDGRYLSCIESSNVRVRIERGVSVSSSAARKASRCTIFLDGAAQGEPFVDNERRVFNLDHHEGCVRAFTLATCEQAMVLVMKGLDLSTNEWQVHANEPDLDTVMAIWILVNHRRLQDVDSDLESRLMPLVRLEGVIDAHGFELAGLAALPPELDRRTRETIEQLRTTELELKAEDRWAESDPLAYTASVLQAIDHAVYGPEDFEGYQEIEELARVAIGSGRFALLCRSDLGIYELEDHLRRVHGDKIGLILLEKEDGVFAVRQTDPFLPVPLARLYERLNLLDPAASPENFWGGSSDIGGSPRATGTALDVDAVADIVRWVFRPPGLAPRLAAVTACIGISAGVVAAARVAATSSWAAGVSPSLISAAGPRGQAAAAAVIVVAGPVLLAAAHSWRAAYFGLRWPITPGWLWLVPMAVVAACAGGAWVPLQLHAAPWRGAGGELLVPVLAVMTAIGAETLFRGALFGFLTMYFPVRWRGTRGRLSIPSLLTAVLAATSTLLLFQPPGWVRGLEPAALPWLLWTAACLVLSLGCSFARERSGSVLAAMALHGLAALAGWWLVPLLG